MIVSTLLALLSLSAASPQGGTTAEAPPALFALVIGANRSVDAELGLLKYADDDAANAFDLFRSLRARSYLLTRLDDNTARLHPQAAAEAFEPVAASLQEVLARLRGDVARARERGVQTVLYFSYAGHGNMKNGQGYITLEDQRLSGEAIKQILHTVAADRTHLIVDACYSFFLAHARGPGGRRRALRGFGKGLGLADQASVGLLLSTSAALESHEWEALQAGVFSHQVRSALYGAADVNLDGQVTYREVAAFVDRANSAVPNERYRPKIFAQPPKASELLVDLRPALDRSLQIEGLHGHQVLEDARGVRLAEFNNAAGQAVHLLRPAGVDLLYLRGLSTRREYTIPPAHGAVVVAALPAHKMPAQTRGAAHNAFELMFSQPFDASVVAAYTLPDADADADADAAAAAEQAPLARAEDASWMMPVAMLGLGSGAVMAVAAGSATALAYSAWLQGQGDISQQRATRLNQDIAAANLTATVLFVGAGLAALSGGAVLAAALLDDSE